jgi:PhzF family phenazine biosynthesis protein
MQLPLYQIDTFTDRLFGGNPACVVPMEDWLPDNILLNITKENAVAETAFFIYKADKIHLRWFTPEIEMDLCGHATLATAHALKSILKYPQDKFVFTTLSGDLIVTVENEKYTLDLPSRKPIPAMLPAILERSLSEQPMATLKSRDYILVYGNEKDIRDIQIDRQLFDQLNLDPGGVVITAKGDNCDFVSRFFTPQATIFEDPVTGSAHCSLIPYWSEQLNKATMTALQLSDRVGKLYCVDNGERVLISGLAKTYSIGTLWIDGL